MRWPLVFGVCENGLQRDQEFLQRFARVQRVDLKLTPMDRPTLDAKAARLLRGRVEAARQQKVAVRALLVHVDCDRAPLSSRRKEVAAWVRRHRVELPVITCAPAPCLERWLCRCAGLAGVSAPAASPCSGWKRAWEKPGGIDLDRVRQAADEATSKMSREADFQAFLEDWKRSLA